MIRFMLFEWQWSCGYLPIHSDGTLVFLAWSSARGHCQIVHWVESLAYKDFDKIMEEDKSKTIQDKGEGLVPKSDAAPVMWTWTGF